MAASSRMLASTSGSPVRPSRQRAHSSGSGFHTSGRPEVPVSKKMRLPCLSAKNLWGSEEEEQEQQEE